MKVAALDLGTNTFLCLIAEVENFKIKKIIEDSVEVVRLGQGVHETKKFHPEALKRAELCLFRFSQIIQKHRPERILAMATSAARDAQNAEDLYAIAHKLSIPIEIIPGEKEAEITYRGAISDLLNDQKMRVVLDIGGGSTELILGHGQKVVFAESINIGCVRLTESFLKNQPASSDQLKKLEKYIEDQLGPCVRQIQKSGMVETLLAVAGTPTELARAEIGSFDSNQIDGYQFTLQQLEEKYQIFSKSSSQEINEKYKITAGRADVITVGVLILKKTCELLNQKKVTVSTRGVRFGIALELAGRPA